MLPNKNLKTRNLRTALLQALWLFATPLFAQDAAPVFVCFEFNDASVANHFPDQQLAERTFSTNLAAVCWTNLPYWNFQPGTSNDFPQLYCRLARGLDLSLLMELRLSDSQTAEPSWSAVLLHPGDDGRIVLPGKDDVGPAIATSLKREILVKKRDSVLHALMANCPLGKTLAILSRLDPPGGVLPLASEKYPQLSRSDFRILCWLSDGQGHSNRVILSSAGIGSDPFLPINGASFPAIAVQHNTWRQNQSPEPANQHTNNLGKLVADKFFLDRLDTD